MSALQEAVLAGDYPRGVALGEALEALTPEDRRWWGVCLFQVGRVVEASRQLELACQQDCLAAQIEVAALLRSKGQHAQALGRLQRVHPSQLAPLDRALWHRERAILGHELGEGRHAVMGELDEAWTAACSAPEAVQASVAHASGLYAARFGDDRLASAYLEFAAGHAHPVRASYVERSWISEHDGC